MPDIVELIMAEHVRISKLTEEVGSALAGIGLAGRDADPYLAWVALARFLRFHIDAAEEIAYPALASAEPGNALTVGDASAADVEMRLALEEAELAAPGSRTWHMAVQAVCTAAKTHITCLESGPLHQFQVHTAPETRHRAGCQWMAFMAAKALDASVPQTWR